MIRTQWAWLELCEGMWCYVTHESVNASRKWADKDTAITELGKEGWTVSGIYPNELSKELELGNEYQGLALTTQHSLK